MTEPHDRAGNTADFTLRPIGVVRASPYLAQGDAPRQGRSAPTVVTEIEVFERYREGLGTLDGISHIHVLLWFDRANRDSLIAHPPHRGGEARPVFCTRSPSRPNPIGLNLAEVLSLRDGVITVAGMDAFEGTPVLDIKPYVPSIDCIPDARDILSERPAPATGQ